MIHISKSKVIIDGIQYEPRFVEIAFPGSTNLPDSYDGRIYKCGEYHYFYGSNLQNNQLDKFWKIGEKQLKNTKSIDSIVEFYKKKETDANLDDYIDNRRSMYPTTDELIVALWEHIVEGKSDNITILQQKRNNIKSKYPKPDIGE